MHSWICEANCWTCSCRTNYFSTPSVILSIRIHTDELLKEAICIISNVFWFITVEITTDTAGIFANNGWLASFSDKNRNLIGCKYTFVRFSWYLIEHLLKCRPCLEAITEFILINQWFALLVLQVIPQLTLSHTFIWQCVHTY